MRPFLVIIFFLVQSHAAINAAPADGHRKDADIWDNMAERVRNAQASQWTRASEDEKDEWLNWMNGFSELSNQKSIEEKAQRNNQLHQVVSNLFRPASPKQSNPIEGTPLGRTRSEVSRERQTIFTCSECGHTFNRQKLLERHWKVHTGERPYQCAFCDTRMSRSDNLLLHMEQQHGFISNTTT